MTTRKVRRWITVVPNDDADDAYIRETLEAETRDMADEERRIDALAQIADVIDEGRDSLTEEQATTLAQLLLPKKKS